MFFIAYSGMAQNASGEEVFNKDFGWSITIPKGFVPVSSEQWAKMQDRGAAAVEDTYGEEVENNATIIFVFRANETNYFESNYQPFDPETDGDYLESVYTVDEMLYTTFKTQLPDAGLDSVHLVESIDGLEFQVFKLTIDYGGNVKLNLLMFSRLFGKKEFTVNIMYVDEAKGKQMLDSWRKSKFAR